MLDIIIPVYNAHETLEKTLLSVALQTYRNKIKVYLVDDCSKESYEKEVKDFESRLDITLLRLEKNSGPGVARQYGIDHSNGEFIMFLDSDDLLYDYKSVENLVSKIGDNDIIFGVMVDEKGDGNYFLEYDSKWCLHGKLYRRNFINKYDLRFNSTRKSEDDAFHKLCMIATDKCKYIDNFAYFYRNNENSIVNSVEDYWFKTLPDYVSNMIWLMEEAKKKKLDEVRTATFAIDIFLYLCKLYIQNIERKDLETLFVESKKFLPYYELYKNVLTIKKKNNMYLDCMWDIEPIVTLDEFATICSEYR